MRSNIFFPCLIFLMVSVVHAYPAFGIQASPINAGCYIASPGKCLIHVDPYTIHVSTGERLRAFKLLAGDSPVYQFATDNSNPPVGDYTPSSPKLDFAVSCGQTYTLALDAKDSGDIDYQNAGLISDIHCPDGAGWLTWIPQAITETGYSRNGGTAVLNGTVNAQGGATQVTFQYGTTTTYGLEVQAIPNGFEDAVNHQVSATVSGLEPKATYHFRVVAKNSAGTTFGKDQVLRMKGPTTLVPVYLLLLD